MPAIPLLGPTGTGKTSALKNLIVDDLKAGRGALVIETNAGRQLKPDSFVRFAVDGWEYSVFVELDNGTEGSRTIGKKLGAYVSYHRLGIEQERFGVFPRVQWLTTTTSRVDLIETEIEQLPKGGRELFGVALVADAVGAITAPDDTKN